MKSKYTKRQINEAIAYWSRVLRHMDENRIVSENSHQYNDQIQKIISEFKPEIKDVMGMSLEHIVKEDPETLNDEVIEKYLDFSDSRGTYYSEYSNMELPVSMHTSVTVLFLDLPGFSARSVSCSKEQWRRVWDGNPYDGWHTEYYDTDIVRNTILEFNDGFKMTQLFDRENDKKWMYSDKQVSRNPIWILGEYLYRNHDKFLIYEAGPFLEKYFKTVKIMALSDINRLFNAILSIPGVKKQLEGKYPDWYSFNSPKPYTREYDTQRFIRKRNSERGKMLMKVRARKFRKEAEQFFAGHPTIAQLLKNKDFESYAAAVLGEGSLEDIFYGRMSEGDFEEPIKYDEMISDMAQEMIDKLSGELPDLIDTPSEVTLEDEITFEEFEEAVESAVNMIVYDFNDRHYTDYIDYD